MDWALLAIPLAPLAGALVLGTAGRRMREPIPGVLGSLAVLAALALSAAAEPGPPRQYFTWIDAGRWSISFALHLDALSQVMILVVTGVGFLIHVYSIGYMKGDPGLARYFCYLNLFTSAMLLLVLAANLPLMFVGWEGVGLCSYLLIGFWYHDLARADAGIKAFVVNRVGDLGFLLGMFGLFSIFGTFTMADMVPGKDVGALWLPCLLLFLGACGKSAQIPLYVWLPDAMAGPTPVSALIHAATMVTAGVYLTARLHAVFVAAPAVMAVIASVAAATALVSGLMGAAEWNLKKVLAYSTISQIAYMFAGAAAGGFAAGIFHLVTHAFFKALLFLGAGAVIHAMAGEEDMRKMGGLGKHARLAWASFFVGGLSLAGIFPLSGFWSKESILSAAFEHGGSTLGGLLVLGSLLTGFYTFRMIVLVFYGASSEERHLHPTPMSMAVPLAILILLSALGGALELVLPERLAPILGAGEHATRPAVLALGLGASVLGIGLAALLYGPRRDWLQALFARNRILSGLRDLAAKKFHVDEAYDLFVVLPLGMFAFASWLLVDRLLIDGLAVDRLSEAVYGAARRLRAAHSGVLSAAVATLAAGALAILGWLWTR